MKCPECKQFEIMSTMLKYVNEDVVTYECSVCGYSEEIILTEEEDY